MDQVRCSKDWQQFKWDFKYRKNNHKNKGGWDVVCEYIWQIDEDRIPEKVLNKELRQEGKIHNLMQCFLVVKLE